MDKCLGKIAREGNQKNEINVSSLLSSLRSTSCTMSCIKPVIMAKIRYHLLKTVKHGHYTQVLSTQEFYNGSHES